MKSIIAVTVIVLFTHCSSTVEPVDDYVMPYGSVHLACGVPKDADSSDDYIIIRHQYCLSYNKNTFIPNWISWELNSGWYGDAPRYEGNFITDVSLPVGFYRVTHSDYTNSGYDRGHLVRSEERTLNDENNKSTFILTNIIPQTPDLNRGVWLDLEYYCESLCKDENKELFVIAGGSGSKTKKLASGVSVPDSCFKIVVVLEKGRSFRDINESTELIAVMMPNIDGVRSDKWEKYITTVDAIEAGTGYDFLNLLDDRIENILEKQISHKTAKRIRHKIL